LNPFWLPGSGPVEPATLDPWTIPKILRARARLEPDTIVYRVLEGGAFVDTNWRQLDRQVRAIACGLHRHGIGRGDRVAILGRSSPTWVAADIAILMAGGITVGLYPTATLAEIVEQLDHVAAKALLVLDHDDAQGVVAAIAGCRSLELTLRPGAAGGSAVALEELMARGEQAQAEDPGLADRLADAGRVDDPMRLFFTSGSTGRQKAVLHTQRSMLLSADAAILRNPAMREKPQRVLAFLPLSHISALLNVYLVPLITGTVAHFGDGDSDLLELIAMTRPTYLALMPRHYQKLAALLAERSAAYRGMRAAIFRWALAVGSAALRRHWAGEPVPEALRIGARAARLLAFRPHLASVGLDAVTRAQTTSAAMPREVATLWGVYGLDLREGYGSTEAPIIACQLDRFPEPGTVGRKMPRLWYELELAGDGEIMVRSATLFSGYWNDPGETAASMTDGWYRTGDVGEFDERGNLRLVGRKKDVIITAGGKSLNPNDIEAAFRDSPYISEIVVAGEGRKYLTALIEVSEEAVRAWLRRKTGDEPGDYATLAGDMAVRELVSAAVSTGNAGLARVAQVKRFRILPRPLDAGHGEISGTRKARRPAILENFRDLIDEMYDRAEEDAISAEMTRAKIG